MSDWLITLTSFHDLILANVCACFLEENGIRCALIKNDLLPGLISPEIIPHGHINLDVLEADLVPALALLQLAGLIPREEAAPKSNPVMGNERTGEILVVCEFCLTEFVINSTVQSSIVNCPRCQEYVDVPESS